MLQVKNPYDMSVDMGKSQVLFNYRPKYLENLHDYEPPLLWTPCSRIGGKISEVSGVLLYEDLYAVDRDFTVELDAADMRRLKSVCKSTAKKIKNCRAPESFMQLFANDSPVQNLISEFSKNSDKVDLSLDLMFAQLVRECITDKCVINRLSPSGDFPEDKLDHLAKYLVSGFSIHDYWKNYYSMMFNQEAMENARQAYIGVFSSGDQSV